MCFCVQAYWVDDHERGNEFLKSIEKKNNQMTVMEIKYLFMDFMH